MWYDKAQAMLDEELDQGYISLKEYYQECKELTREIEAARESAAQDSYNDTYNDY